MSLHADTNEAVFHTVSSSYRMSNLDDEKES